ncbi:hypothetical protein [Arthrobacter sp. NicSoilB8]|uniref:hypothetical protein n=1 Tax=Arthrobacter sp. NicSoilB8 TaxID=2830998 RepID=UPI001CC7C1CF|nr:hypothetical protein [Arthrobacter sp. NicSoilB8]
MMLHRHTLGTEWIAADEGTTRSQRLASSPPLAFARAALDPITVARLQGAVGNQTVLELLRGGTPVAGRPQPVVGLEAAVVFQRDKTEGKGSPAKRTIGGGQQQLWVVRDRTIGLGGGVLVSDLADFKSRVMGTSDKDGWTLVLAIHGSEDRLGAQAPPDWQKNAVFYRADDIEALFGKDEAFAKWRDEFGPTQLSLVSCQVSASFEKALITNLTRPGDKGVRQQGRGLGAGCKPVSNAWAIGEAPKTRRQYDRLDETGKQKALDKLGELNQKWGYYGAPPVPDDQLVHYYYDEDPKGEWVTVEVQVDNGKHELTPTGIPYWNRTFGPDAARFRQLCTQGVGTLKERESKAPTVAD